MAEVYRPADLDPPSPASRRPAIIGLLAVVICVACTSTVAVVWAGRGASDLSLEAAIHVVCDPATPAKQRAAAAAQIRRLCQSGIDALRATAGELEASRLGLQHLGVR